MESEFLATILLLLHKSNTRSHAGASSDRNPYCRVAIVNQKHYHPGSEFKYLTDWQKTGYVTDIAITDSKKATLEPVWNEDIEL